MSDPWRDPIDGQDPLPEGVFVEPLAMQLEPCQAGTREARKFGLRPVSTIPCDVNAIVRITWPERGEEMLLCFNHSQVKFDQLRAIERRRREEAAALPFVELVQPPLPAPATQPLLVTVNTPPPLPAPTQAPALPAPTAMTALPAPSEPAVSTSIQPATSAANGLAMPATALSVQTHEEAAVMATLSLPPLGEGALPLPPERNAAFVYLARLASGSRRTMREALDEIAQFLWGKRADAACAPWHTLRYAHTSTVRAHLAEKNAPATANKKLAALRSVLKEAWKLGLLPTDEYHKAVEIDGVKGDHLPVGRALAKDQVDALYTTCAKDATFWGRRDAALLALLQGVALRRAEACAMTLADYDPQTGQVVVRRGKGGKQRAIWLPPPGRAAIEEWIAVRGREPGFLLAAISPTGRPRPERAMSTETVYARLQVLAGRADIPRFSPHDLRRTYATDAIADGEDLVTVKRLMGHESIETTVRYDRRGEAVLREAAVKRYLPFHPATAAALPLPSEIPAVPAEKAAAPPSVGAAMPPELPEKIAPSRTSTTKKSAKRRTVLQKKAPRIAPAARSRARTTRRPRKTTTKRPAESRRKPVEAQRLRGRSGAIARRSTRRKA